MMKDTVSDMRRHIWNNDSDSTTTNNIDDELEKKAQKKIDDLKKELSDELSKMFSKQNKTDSQLQNLKGELTNLIEKAVIQTRNVETEAREETIRDYILRTFRSIRKRRKRIFVDTIIEKAIEDGVSPKHLIDELHKMKEDKIIDFEGDKIRNGMVEIRFK